MTINELVASEREKLKAEQAKAEAEAEAKRKQKEKIKKILLNYLKYLYEYITQVDIPSWYSKMAKQYVDFSFRSPKAFSVELNLSLCEITYRRCEEQFSFFPEEKILLDDNSPHAIFRENIGGIITLLIIHPLEPGYLEFILRNVDDKLEGLIPEILQEEYGKDNVTAFGSDNDWFVIKNFKP